MAVKNTKAIALSALSRPMAPAEGEVTAVNIGSDINARIADEIALLPTLGLDALRSRYRQLTRKSAPQHIPGWLLVRLIAHQMQSKCFGDLDKESKKFLAGIAARIEKARQRVVVDGSPFKSDIKLLMRIVPGIARPSRLQPGALLVREYGGVLHRVTVMENGYFWAGKRYGSLSEVAYAITGTNWSGPRFFGLLNGKTEILSASEDDAALTPLQDKPQASSLNRPDPEVNDEK